MTRSQQMDELLDVLIESGGKPCFHTWFSGKVPTKWAWLHRDKYSILLIPWELPSLRPFCTCFLSGMTVWSSFLKFPILLQKNKVEQCWWETLQGITIWSFAFEHYPSPLMLPITSGGFCGYYQSPFPPEDDRSYPLPFQAIVHSHLPCRPQPIAITHATCHWAPFLSWEVLLMDRLTSLVEWAWRFRSLVTDEMIKAKPWGTLQKKLGNLCLRKWERDSQRLSAKQGRSIQVWWGQTGKGRWQLYQRSWQDPEQRGASGKGLERSQKWWESGLEDVESLVCLRSCTGPVVPHF